MSTESTRLSPGVRLFAAMVLLFLSLGVSLLLAPRLFAARWPWKLTPFNARFLGAFYTAECVAMAALFWRNRWVPGRLVLPLATVFTVVVTLVSCLYFGERFNPRSRGTWGWFIVYVGSALAAGYYWWRYRRLPPEQTVSLGQAWRMYLAVHATLLGLYGAGLLLAPVAFAVFWPWLVDAFHARVYAAIFLVSGYGAWILRRAASSMELVVFGLALALLGWAAIMGTFIVDREVHRVAWGAPGTWVWMALFLWLGVAGLVMAWRGHRE